MPNKRISELPVATTPLDGTELMEGVQGGVNVKFTSQDVADLGGGGGGSVDSVTGDFVDNADPANPVIDITDWAVGGTKGIASESDQTESETVISQANASSTIGLANNRGISEFSLWYAIRKFTTLAWSWTLTQTFTAGTIHSNVTASLMAAFDSSKRLVSIAYASLSDMITGTDSTKPLTTSVFISFRSLVRTSVTVSAGTLTLNLAGARERRFYVPSASAISSNFTLAFSNESDSEQWELYLPITGTVTMTCPSSVKAGNDQKIAGKWNDGTKVFTLVGVTATYFKVVFNRVDSSVVAMRVDPDYLI